jgi:hypothetical protein
VAAAQLGVGGHGQLALLPGCLVPVGPVGHDRREHGLAFAVGVVHGTVAGGQDLLSAGRMFVAASGGRLCVSLALPLADLEYRLHRAFPQLNRIFPLC